MEHNLSEGNSVVIYPGGEDELIRSTPGSEVVCIGNRKGIFEIAIKANVKIVPTLCYYESDLFSNWANVPFRTWMKKTIGTAAQFTWGHPFIPFYPKMFKVLEIVIGDPIYADTVEEFREKYIQSIKNMRKMYPPTDADRGFEII